MAGLADELGDLLLQVVFHAQMASEQGLFDFGNVVEAITAKMVCRHPHVFGAAQDLSPEAVRKSWGEIKAQEKADRQAGRPAAKGLLADIPAALPALSRAVKLQARAGSVGFDWNDPRQVLAKIREETDEIEAALDGGNKGEIADEIGDVLFALANLARHVGVDPESCARSTNAKFERRFAHIEAALGERGETLVATPLAEMERLWQEAKTAERGNGPNNPRKINLCK